MICPSCAKENTPEVQFCIYCNTDLKKVEPPMDSVQGKSEDSQKNAESAPVRSTGNKLRSKPNISRMIWLMFVVGILAFASFGIGALFYHPNSPFSGDVEIKVTDKFYTWSSSGKAIGLNITFTNNKNYEINFYTGDFSVRSKDGVTYPETVQVMGNPDIVKPGKTVKLQHGFTVDRNETLESITKLVYDTNQYWGGKHHIHIEVDI